MESDTPDHQSNPNPYDEVLIVRGLLAMKRPAEVQLSREEGEALRQGLEGDALTADDRRVLGQILQWYFGLVFTLQEASSALSGCGPCCLVTSPKSARVGPQVGRPPPEGATGGMHRKPKLTAINGLLAVIAPAMGVRSRGVCESRAPGMPS